MIYQLARISAFLGALIGATFAHSQQPMSLKDFAQYALDNDPLLLQSTQRQTAKTEQASALLAIPDPSVRLGFANLPVDSFEFDQEPMTQLTVGIKQALPRLATRQLKNQQGMRLAAEQAHKTQLRRAEVLRQSSLAWLSTYGAQRKAALLNEQKAILGTLYASKINTYEHSASARQSTLLRLQTEILMLDEQLLQVQGEQQALLQHLHYWAPNLNHAQLADLKPEGLTTLYTLGDTLIEDSAAEIEQTLLQHPSLRIHDERLITADLSTELAKDAYKPQVAVELSYGYRDDSPLGTARSDFASIALSFDLPIRQSQRQDRHLRAAEAMRRAAGFERSYAARQLKSEALALQAKVRQLKQRTTLLRDDLLPLSSTQITSLEIESLHNAIALTDLLDAQVGHNQYQLKLNDTEIALWKTTIELQFYLQANIAGTQETGHEN